MVQLHTLTAPQRTRWRTHPRKVLGNLVIWVPDLVVRRRVNQAAIGYPLSSLSFDNPDLEPGDPNDMEAGMLIKFYDGATGAYKGSTRLLRGASGSVITIHPVGQGDLEIEDNDIFEVYDDYPPYALIPYISPDGTLYKNYEVTFGGQTENFPPVANAIVDRYADRIDPVTNVITVNLDATSSFPMADGATIASYLWDVKDGTITVGTAASASITATFPAGKRWVKLTVTDSNGVESIKRVPIWAANGTTFKTYRARVSRRGYTHSVGWEASFDLYEADTSLIPDHALVIFYLDEWYGDTRANLRDTNTGFFGWITNETLHLEPLWSDNAINCQGPLAILQQRPAFPQTVRRATDPTNWAEVKDLDWWRTIIYLLMWHSNILELVNIERPDFHYFYPVPRLDSEAGTLYNQVDFLARAVFAQFTCDKTGRLYLRRNPHTMNEGERAGATPLVDLTAADLVGDGQGPQFERAHWDRLGWLKASAIVANPATSEPLLAIAPGTTPGQGVQIDALDRVLVANQDDFNIRAGHVYAYRQSRRDGRRVMRQGTLTLAHGGDAIDPAWQEPATLTLDASTNARGFEFNAARMVPYALDVIDDHEHQASLERLTVEEECRGAPATTVPVPEDTSDDYPPASTPPPVYTPPTTSYGPGTKSGLLVLNIYHGTNTLGGRVYYSLEMSGGIWTPLHGGLTPVAPNRYGAMVDGFLNPSNTNEAFLIISNTMMSYSSTPNGQGGVYRNRSWKTGGDWEVMISNDAINTLLGTTQWQILSANTTIAAEGCIYLLIHSLGLSQTLVVRTMDYGATIAKSPALKVLGTADIRNGGVWVGATNANKVIVGARGSGGRIGVWVSEWGSFAPIDGGLWDAKWSEDTSLDAGVMPMVPYLRWDGTVNTGETEMYIIGIDTGVKRSTDGGSTFADWVPDGDCDVMFVSAHVTHQGVGAFSVSAFQPGQAGFWLKDPGKLRIAAGDPAGYVEKTLPLARCTWAGGWPGNNSQFYIGSPWFWKDYLNPNGTPIIMFSNDGANNFTDWTGNLWTYHALDAAAGLVRVSPDWLDV
jgi:hypothetical protein